MNALCGLLAGTCLVGALVLPARGEGPSAVAGWRGDGTGRFPAAEPPVEWDADDGTNVLWRAEVGKSQSSPVVAGERIFVTAEKDWLVCLDRKSGKVLWKRDHAPARLPAAQRPKKRLPTGPGGGYSIPTPVTDGSSVYASYATGVVVAYDAAGRRRWLRLLDRPQATEFGRSASPRLAGDKLIVSIGHLTALDPRTGKTLWEAPEAKCGYGTPAVTKIGVAAVAVTAEGHVVRLSDGRLLASKIARSEFSSPLVHGSVAYFADDPTVAIRLPASADGKARPRPLWTTETEGEFYASPVLRDGKLYCLSDAGVLYALDARTGKVVLRKKLPIASADPPPGTESANLYPSLVLTRGHLLLSNDRGHALVLAPAEACKKVSANYLDGGSGATFAVAGKTLFLRAGAKLYCIGAR